MAITIELQRTPRATTRSQQGSSVKVGAALWLVQGLLAILFLFSGTFKLVAPLDMMAAQMPIDLPGWFVRFLGLAEVLGALGLILPGALRIKPRLTPLAACGLICIMTGATVITLAVGGGAMALMPFIVGLLAATVGYGRVRLAPQASR
jgi:DoxX-like protein